jgi:D-3-phosphoglycerate dehydrogenase
MVSLLRIDNPRVIADNSKRGGFLRVTRLDLWLDSAFDERLRREPEVELTVCRIADSREKILSELQKAHVFHVSSAKDELPKEWFVTEALLARCPELLCVSSYGAGYDTIDVEACTRAGIPVLNQAGGNAVSVAEHTLGFILALLRRFGEHERLLRSPRRDFVREDVMGREAAGKVLGLVGIGHTGSRVAALAKAFDMRVLAFDPFLEKQEIAKRAAQAVTFDELLKESDIVSLHCPRNGETLGMMNAQAFARMKRGALFISTARGGIHDEQALAAALASGHLGGAALDVWEREPPPPGHPLLALQNVLATYHTAGVTHECRRNMAAIAAEQLVVLRKGGRPPRIANPEAWPRFQEKFKRKFPSQR